MEHTTIAVDLAESVFQVAVSHRPGHLDEEHRLSRERFLTFFAQRPAATIVLEACGSAHYWARPLEPFGHAVRLLPAHDVRPYVRRNTTDRTDAKGLLEASRNEEIRPVPVKTLEHQAIASLHRLRSTWLATRTARLNTVRGLLREFSIFIPVGARHVIPCVRSLVNDPAPVPLLLHTTLAAACDEIVVLEANMQAVEHQLATLAGQMADVTLLRTVPGVGVITATALVALVTDIRRFPSGRHFASFLGLTPKAEATRPPSANLQAQQVRFNRFRHEYNDDRPHEALDQETPASVYRRSTRELPRQLAPLEYPGHFEVRLVSRNSGIRWNRRWVCVTHTLAGEYVGLEEVGDGLWDVYFGPVKLGRLDERIHRIEDHKGRTVRKVLPMSPD
jgi:transposase